MATIVLSYDHDTWTWTAACDSCQWTVRTGSGDEARILTEWHQRAHEAA